MHRNNRHKHSILAAPFHLLKRLIALTVIALLLSSCHGHNKDRHAKTTIITAKEEQPVTHLYFSGVLSPITTTPVLSPVAGAVSQMHFTYGQRLKKGQVILVMNSKALAAQYRQAVNNFLEQKQKRSLTKTQFTAAQALYDAGVMSQNSFESAKASYENAVLHFLQFQYQLHQVLRTAHISPQVIEGLSLSQPEEINRLLQIHFRNIEVRATAPGIALFPDNQNAQSTGNSQLSVGSVVKAGQLLLSIGNLSGLSATFDASEIDIDKLHPGMSVHVTSSAFPGELLTGYIHAVSAQAAAQSGSGGGLSFFAISINIPAIPSSLLHKIRVGMTAKFRIDLKGQAHVMLPLDAVTQQNGVPVVTVIQSDKKVVVPIVTGQTTSTQVAVISGVKPGDQVVVHAQAD